MVAEATVTGAMRNMIAKKEALDSEGREHRDQGRRRITTTLQSTTTRHRAHAVAVDVANLPSSIVCRFLHMRTHEKGEGKKHKDNQS